MIAAEGNGEAGITFREFGPSLSLVDAKGFSTIVGATQLEKSSGTVRRSTSAASVMLLEPNKKVIWQTP
jgi:hypothetical protein